MQLASSTARARPAVGGPTNAHPMLLHRRYAPRRLPGKDARSVQVATAAAVMTAEPRTSLKPDSAPDFAFVGVAARPSVGASFDDGTSGYGEFGMDVVLPVAPAKIFDFVPKEGQVVELAGPFIDARWQPTERPTDPNLQELAKLVRNSKLNQAIAKKLELGIALSSQQSSSSSSDESMDGCTAPAKKNAFNLKLLAEYHVDVLKKAGVMIQHGIDEAGLAYRRQRLLRTLPGFKPAASESMPSADCASPASSDSIDEASLLSDQMRVTVRRMEVLEAQLKRHNARVLPRHYGPKRASSTAPAPAMTAAHASGSAALDWCSAVDPPRATSRLAVIVRAMQDDCAAMEAACSEALAQLN